MVCIIICFLLCYVETEIETLPFFTLDGIPELRELEREEDAASEPINIPNGFLFGDQYVSIAYVSI